MEFSPLGCGAFDRLSPLSLVSRLTAHRRRWVGALCTTQAPLSRGTAVAQGHAVLDFLLVSLGLPDVLERCGDDLGSIMHGRELLSSIKPFTRFLGCPVQSRVIYFLDNLIEFGLCEMPATGLTAFVRAADMIEGVAYGGLPGFGGTLFRRLLDEMHK